MPEGKLTGCATDGCQRPVSVRFERGGVGSEYCNECYAKIIAISASPVVGEVVCPDCDRHVMATPEPATGWIAKCGRRLTRLDECHSGGCAALALTEQKP